MGERDPDSFGFSFSDTARGLTRADANNHAITPISVSQTGKSDCGKNGIDMDAAPAEPIGSSNHILTGELRKSNPLYPVRVQSNPPVPVLGIRF